MKNSTSYARALTVAGLALFSLGLVGGAQAQPAPKTAKATASRKPRAKNMTPRMVTATETATGKTLTPELKAQLTTALRARQTAIDAANEKYYADFAALTGLTADQAREIDKPTRVKAPTDPKVTTTTNVDNLTTDEDETAPAVSPQTP